MGRSHLEATHSKNRNIRKLIINATQLRNWATQLQTTQQKIKLQTLPQKIQPKLKSKSNDSNSKHPKNDIPKMPQNGHLRGAAAYPPTALALPWTFPTAPAVGQRRRLGAAVADVVAVQVQLSKRRVRLQHFCQSLRPPRNGTRWKR